MRVAYVRTGGRLDRAYLTRSDGSTATIHPHGYGNRLPHDLPHFAVERALGLAGGFWGLLASGVDWERVNAATNRGVRNVLGGDASELRLAEGAVSSVGEGATGELNIVYRSAGVEPPPDLADRADRAVVDLSELASAWASIAPGGQLLLDWPDHLSRALRRLDPRAGMDANAVPRHRSARPQRGRR